MSVCNANTLLAAGLSYQNAEGQSIQILKAQLLCDWLNATPASETGILGEGGESLLGEGGEEIIGE